MHLLQTWFPVACFPFLYLYISLLINRCAYAADREVTLRGRSTKPDVNLYCLFFFYQQQGRQFPKNTS